MNKIGRKQQSLGPLLYYQPINSKLSEAMIYSFIARQNQVLIEYSPHKGNFSQFAVQQILPKVNRSKMCGQYSAITHNFYVLVKGQYVFLAMVQKDYELRIAMSFLKKIQQLLFEKYDVEVREKAVAHSLKDFEETLKQTMKKYNDKGEVDKLTRAKQLLEELSRQCLENMDLMINRGELIEISVEKSKTLAKESLDMKDNAIKLNKQMWWSSNKFKIGVGLVIVVALMVVILAVAI